jgi:hypothetical protein
MSSSTVSRKLSPNFFWAPGAQLMGNLRFGIKAAVISVVFLLPIGILSWTLYSLKSESIAFPRSQFARYFLPNL